jgi:hypothetical protein
MKAKPALAYVVLSFVTSSAASQRLDWVDFFHQMASRDPAIREAAEQKLSSLGTGFGELEADVLRIDVRAMLPVLDDPNREVRFKVSGLISILAIGRQDGSAVLEPAVPILLVHFKRIIKTAHPQNSPGRPVMCPANSAKALPLTTVQRESDVGTSSWTGRDRPR